MVGVLLMAGCTSAPVLGQPRTIVAAEATGLDLTVGESVSLRAPAESPRWRLSGADDLITVDPTGDVPATAWTLTARVRGQGELTLDAVMATAPCPSPPDCPPPPAPPRLTLVVTVR